MPGYPSKRIFDIFFALLGLAVSAPLMLFVAIVVRSTIGAPILFRQDRTGLGGVTFRIAKFRTLANDHCHQADPNGEQALSTTSRLLRTFGLDELPQLWNILKGDMSFVGPRPLLAEYMPLYSPTQRRRHSVRPGLTGLAQVNGRTRISWERQFELDIDYVDRCSLALDLNIALRTASLLLFRRTDDAGTSPRSAFTGTVSKGSEKELDCIDRRDA